MRDWCKGEGPPPTLENFDQYNECVDAIWSYSHLQETLSIICHFKRPWIVPNTGQFNEIFDDILKHFGCSCANLCNSVNKLKFYALVQAVLLYKFSYKELRPLGVSFIPTLSVIKVFKSFQFSAIPPHTLIPGIVFGWAQQSPHGWTYYESNCQIVVFMKIYPYIDVA